MKALAKEPAERYRDAADFARALRRVESGRRRRWTVAAVGVIALLAVGLAVAYTVLPDRTSTEPANSSPEIAADALPMEGLDSKVPVSNVQIPPLQPVAHFTFDKLDDRLENTGLFGAATTLAPRGKITFTAPGDPDAPPKILGDGVRFADEVPPPGLLADKALLADRAWSMALWFRRDRAESEDFLLFLGRLDGHGGGGSEFAVVLAPKDELFLEHYPNWKPPGVRLLPENVPLARDAWHHLVLTFTADAPAITIAGQLTAYLDGRQIAKIDDVFLGNALSYRDSALVFGSINRLYDLVNQTRSFDGVLADIRIFSAALTRTQVADLWKEAASSAEPPLKGRPRDKENAAGHGE